MMDSFSDLFPTYRLLGQEYLLPDGGRVDLLAMKGDRAVLFELKLGDADPTPQLERYARMFQDPILIGVTEKSSAWRALPPACHLLHLSQPQRSCAGAPEGTSVPDAGRGPDTAARTGAQLLFLLML